MKLSHAIEIVMGDWSGDGHRETTTELLFSNLKKEEIEQAYQIGVKKSGVDLYLVACDYNDSNLYIGDWTKLNQAGFTLEKLFLGDTFSLEKARKNIGKNFPIELYFEHFMNIWLFLVKLGNPDFEYNKGEKKENVINIGGYGLFNR